MGGECAVRDGVLTQWLDFGGTRLGSDEGGQNWLLEGPSFCALHAGNQKTLRSEGAHESIQGTHAILAHRSIFRTRMTKQPDMPD